MPAFVHTNTRLQTGLSVVSESVSEQASGLVTVQMEFVYRKTNNAQLHKLFYSDAPPPIFPSCIAASDLITRKLYMVDRTFQTANGLTTVAAQYAGGYANKRSNHLRYVDRESERSYSEVAGPYGLTLYNPDRTSGNTYVNYDNLFRTIAYTWIPLVHTFEYVEVGSVAAYAPTAPDSKELFELSSFFSSIPAADPDRGWSALKRISYEKSWFESRFTPDQRAVKEDRKPIYVTPTVKTIQHRFYL